MTKEYKGIPYSSMSLPLIPVGHPDYVWYGPEATDVQRTWRRYGWKPLEEQRVAASAAKHEATKTVRQLRKAV